MSDDWGNDDWGDSGTATSAPTPMDTSTAKSNGTGGDDWGNDSWGGGSSSIPTKSFQGGGGSGGPRKCFNCQEEGHTSRDCPQPKKERSGGCYNCGASGHMSRDCPEPKKERSGGGGNRNCFNCGSADHMSRECSEPKKPRAITCYNCQQEGHGSRECPEPKKGGGGFRATKTDDDDWGTPTNGATKASTDEMDWGTGPTESSNDRSGGGGGSGCRRCGEDGHFARDCPKNDGVGPNTCRRCKKEGHKAVECTEEVLGEDGKPLPPPYKPEVINEDSANLYETIPSGINFDRYDKIKVNVSGVSPPNSINAFDDVITSDVIKDAIKMCKYTRPTPVQKYAIPIITAKRDLMACAQTGSGKTAAFVLPILQELFRIADQYSLYGAAVQTPLCVVISPTRELAIQIHTEAVKFAKGSIIKPCLVYGGTSSGYQAAHISKGAHFLVATPGRLLDFVNKGKISFENLKYLVLDEADRMIDQGFIPDVRRMVSHDSMPKKEERQTLMFSATFPDEVQRLAQEFLKPDYLFLTVGIVGSANSDVEQTFVEVEGKQKRSKLMDILKASDSNDRTMIFVEKKKTADFIASYLSQNQLMATSIHGDRFQSQREQALHDFRSGRMPVLVATSVAARGLDIKDVKHVINYDMPKEIDEYVHRIGRTGRVGNIGKATSFFDPTSDNDIGLTASLIKVLEGAEQSIPEFLQDSSSGVRNTMNGGTFGGTDVRPVSHVYLFVRQII